MANSTVNLQAKGLNISPNQLSVPEGSLTEAKNVIIKRDNVIESRRGYKIYGTELPDTTDRNKQLMVYRDRILRHYADTLEFDSDGIGTYAAFAGSLAEVQAGLRTKFTQANNNLYFTSSEGIKKISAKTTADFRTSSGFVTDAGGVKALDFTALLQYYSGDATSWFTQDSAVAYQVVWGSTDANGNLVLGAPSQREEVYNSLRQVLIQDYLGVLGALDDVNQTGSMITDGNYLNTLKLSLSISADELRTKLIALTEKLDADILLVGTGAPLTIDPVFATGIQVTGQAVTIQFSSGNPTQYISIGDKIKLSGFTMASGSINGVQTVTSVTSVPGTGTIQFTNPTALTAPATVYGDIFSNNYRTITQPGVIDIPTPNDELVALQTYLNAIMTRLKDELNGVISNTLKSEYIVSLDVTKSATVKINLTIPEGITVDYFFQVYRSDMSSAIGVSAIEDISPNTEMKLVYEAYPTDAELEAGVIEFEDTVLDAFRGTAIYTSPSQEGALQTNDPPPLSKDIAQFKGYTFFANTRTRHNLTLNLLGVENMLADYALGKTPKVAISDTSGAVSTYSLIKGVSEISNFDAPSFAAVSAIPLANRYFDLTTPSKNYRVWYAALIGDIAPADAGRILIKIQLYALPIVTAADVAARTRDVIARYVEDFTTSAAGATVTITNVDAGSVKNLSFHADMLTGGFVLGTITQGAGELVTPEVTEVTTVADVAGSLAGSYILLTSAQNQKLFVVWFRVGILGSPPSYPARTAIKVEIPLNATAAQVAEALANALNDYPSYFLGSSISNVVTITNVGSGECDSPSNGGISPGFSYSVIQEGALQALLSDNISPGVSVDETSRSLIRVINKNDSSNLYTYYITGSGVRTGTIVLENKNIADNQFYVVANNANTGDSFTPSIKPEVVTAPVAGAITTGATPTITLANHKLVDGDKVILSLTDSTPAVDGLFTVSSVTPNTFQVSKYIESVGATQTVTGIRQSQVVKSTNAELSNRVYFSKYQQPEAVPQFSNTIDVGSTGGEILRIFPVRDSLFVFKSDGLYRISGEIAPFSVSLFDSSCICIAPDSVSSSNNLIYSWTRKGIEVVSESGVQTISRQIDTAILKLPTAAYADFKTATWGIGYESDSSYTVYTIKNPSDTSATIGYRYSNLTNSWTIFDRKDICGIVHPTQDKIYVGAGDTNNTEVERKDFNRYDYSDRELAKEILSNSVSNEGRNIIFGTIVDLSLGDVIVQEVYLTTYKYNNILKKLDLDPGPAFNDYEATLLASTGNSMRLKLEALTQKLDLDTTVVQNDFTSITANKNGTIASNSDTTTTVITDVAHGLITGRVISIIGSNSTPSIDGTWTVTALTADTFSIPVGVLTAGTAGAWSTDTNNFSDIRHCFNKVCTKLNADAGVIFTNYNSIDDLTSIEGVITAINNQSKLVSINVPLTWIVGDITVFKAIDTVFQYCPIIFGDALSYKQVQESTVMYENKSFTKATLSFASDLMPELQGIEFLGDGNGTFGMGTGVFGAGYFGGGSHGAPFRTYIPRNSQRCRYIICRHQHKVAREKWAVFGVSLTANTNLSSRAYR